MKQARSRQGMELAIKEADYGALQRFQKPMNIKSCPEVSMVISTDSYMCCKGAMNFAYFLHL